MNFIYVTSKKIMKKNFWINYLDC